MSIEEFKKLAQSNRPICSLVSSQRYRLGNFYHLFPSQKKALGFVASVAVMCCYGVNSNMTTACARERNEAKWLEQRETVEYHFPGILPLTFPHLL